MFTAEEARTKTEETRLKEIREAEKRAIMWADKALSNLEKIIKDWAGRSITPEVRTSPPEITDLDSREPNGPSWMPEDFNFQHFMKGLKEAGYKIKCHEANRAIVYSEDLWNRKYPFTVSWETDHE